MSSNVISRIRQILCQLIFKILEKPNLGILRKLLSMDVEFEELNSKSLLLVQANSFNYDAESKLTSSSMKNSEKNDRELD